MTWMLAKQKLLAHLRTGTDARVVLEGDTATIAKRPALLFADVDGGLAEFSVLGAIHYAKVLYIKVLGADADSLEALMRQVRRCWEKDTPAGVARRQALTTLGVLNIYPAASGAKSMLAAGSTTQDYEGVVELTCHFRETA